MEKFIPHPEYAIDPSQLKEEDAIILVDKPAGISSFGVVAKVRGALKQKFGHKVKIGHTGTLDPFATGLLILLSGKMTKKSSDFLKLDKVYEATLRLGYTSTTGDPEGEITEYPQKTEFMFDGKTQQYPSEGPSERGSARMSADRPWRRAGRTQPELDIVEPTLQSFIGTITQAPPKFSAIKINGQRAYQLARKGESFEIPSRQVEIYSIEILDYNYPKLTIRVHCSSGTYIRTLAEDIGKALNTGAYLISLRRTKIGNFDVKNAIINLC